jgi:DNA polymerase III alpha subunit (gram-positive type)
MKLLITDTETGGLDPTKQDVLTLAFAVWEDNKILDRIEFKVSKEEYKTNEEAMKVNKINLEKLREEGKAN